MSKFGVETTKKCRNDRVSKGPGVETTGYPNRDLGNLGLTTIGDKARLRAAGERNSATGKTCWILFVYGK